MSSSDPPGSAASSVASLDPNNSSTNKGPSILDRIYHRTVAPTDLRPCHALESSSYPSDEAASLSTLQYRQHHAARYFRCSVILDADTKATDSLKMSGKIVGFVTGTRCWDFNDASLSTHDPRGPMLAIHSVVVDEEYRNQGVGGTMLTEYVSAIRKMDLTYPLDRIVLMAKADKLAFYVRAGFQVVGVSPIVHGRDVWYECSLNVRPDGGGGGGVVGGTNTPNTGSTGMTKPLGLGESSTAGSRPCWIVDSFADVNRAGSGNPAAVVLCPPGAGPDGDKYERWMQTVAMEFNLSETAFVWEKAGTGGSGSGSGGENGGSSGAGAGGNGTGTGAGGGGGGGGGGDGGETIRYAIRYYTRTGAEVDLCGHATLAAASVLLQAANTSDGRIPRRTEVSSVVFYARNDVLKATVAPKKEGSGAAGAAAGGGGGGGGGSSSSSSSAPNLRIAMDFPWRSVNAVDKPADRVAVLDMLKSAFGIEEGGADVKAGGGAEGQAEGGGTGGGQNGRNILYLGIDSVGEDLLVELTPEAFGKVGGPEDAVDISALGAWGGGYKRGVILCCLANKKGGGTGDEQDGSGGGGSKRTEEHEEAAAAGGAGGIDFHSRFFGPKVGIDEDPVTGSAHCTLGPYFASKLGGGRSRVVGWQASARGGVVECILQDNGGSNGGGEGGDDDDDGGKARRVCIVGTAVTTVTGTLHI